MTVNRVWVGKQGMEGRMFTRINQMVSVLRLLIDYLGRYSHAFLEVLRNAYIARFKIQSNIT